MTLQTLAALKGMLKPEQIWPDHDLLRFLRARKWDLQAAFEQFTKMLVRHPSPYTLSLVEAGIS